MSIDLLLLIGSGLCLLVGLAGCVLPGLPGPPLSYVGLLLLHFSNRVQFTTWQLVGWLLLTLLTVALDYFMPLWGVKKWNGTKWGSWGCVAGTLAGCFVFPPWGILIGPFAGAFLSELLFARQGIDRALQAALGAFVGFLLGTLSKLIVCGWFVFCFVKALL